jgi:hypothetical protein
MPEVYTITIDELYNILLKGTLILRKGKMQHKIQFDIFCASPTFLTTKKKIKISNYSKAICTELVYRI